MNLSVLSHRLSNVSLLSHKVLQRNFHTANGPVFFQATDPLWGSPLKKKSKAHLELQKIRAEKKKKKLLKEIKKLEKNAGQLKPLEEAEPTMTLISETELRKRELPPLTREQQDRRRQRELEWCRHTQQRHAEEVQTVAATLRAQQTALRELKKVSLELWTEAVQPEPLGLPFSRRGPALSLPIPQYASPDGDYIDVSKVWK